MIYPQPTTAVCLPVNYNKRCVHTYLPAAVRKIVITYTVSRKKF